MPDIRMSASSIARTAPSATAVKARFRVRGTPDSRVQNVSRMKAKSIRKPSAGRAVSGSSAFWNSRVDTQVMMR